MPLSLDIQDRLVSLLSSDTSLSGLYTGAILEDDPLTASAANSPLVAVVLAENDFMGQSLGGSGVGQHNVVTTFSLVAYQALGDNAPATLKAAKTSLVTLTQALCEAVWKVRADPAATSRLWYQMKFRVPATKYVSANNLRKSITQVDIISSVRNR